MSSQAESSRVDTGTFISRKMFRIRIFVARLVRLVSAENCVNKFARKHLIMLSTEFINIKFLIY